MIRLGVLTCLWKREELAALMLQHHEALREELAKDDIRLELLAVGSEGKQSMALASRCRWDYLEHANEPLSEKWNAGMRELRRFTGDGLDGLVILGSDDFVTARLFRRWARALQEGVQYAGLLNGYLWNAGDDRACVQYYKTARNGEPLGAGRMIGRKLLEALKWKPWADGLASGLDRSLTDRVAAVAVAPTLVLPMSAETGPMLDVHVEDDQRMTSWDRMADTADPATGDQATSEFPHELIARLRYVADPVRRCRKVFDGGRGAATLIVKNESARLRACLESVARVAGRCYIVDTGSKDRTHEMAAACGAFLRESKHEGGVDFSAWRNEVLAFAREHHEKRVLMIDADQVLEEVGGLERWLTARERSAFEAAVVTIHAEGPNGAVEDYDSPQGMNPRTAWFEHPVHNQLRGFGPLTYVGATFKTSYRTNCRAKAKRSLPVLRQFIREHPKNPHGWFYAGRHAKSLGWVRLAHRMNRRVVALAPSVVEYATAWADLVLSTILLEGVEPAEAVLAKAREYHPGFDELWCLATSLAGVRWTECARNPGLYAFLPRSHHRVGAEFPRVAKAMDLPLYWHRADAD